MPEVLIKTDLLTADAHSIQSLMHDYSPCRDSLGGTLRLLLSACPHLLKTAQLRYAREPKTATTQLVEIIILIHLLTEIPT